MRRSHRDECPGRRRKAWSLPSGIPRIPPLHAQSFWRSANGLAANRLSLPIDRTV